MTQPKFKAGDKVKTAAGLDGEIVQVNTAGTAALVNAGKGDSFESSWYAVDSLKKPGRTKKVAETESEDDDSQESEDDATDESQDDSE